MEIVESATPTGPRVAGEGECPCHAGGFII